ncbi:hypothetical protein CcrC1_gp328 [Caulobacter phage C1]|nr:hypothetical protein CcrC1_gp328 [Caulobacter phage C1]UTU08557.1 hypothetical protein CcrC2_gp329 [Caulobacter phage C2]UTU09073.1 hypothetical protein CcrJ4_gp324 [Caulobacter phage J4]UTU10190.1 hypothetical protein CcrRB23_gp328 [Caulobacter phage RB23]WGN97224.1 hypothetical protein [Bertelyvirus sp.]
MPAVLTVEDALRLLGDMPKSAILVIGGETVSSITTQQGRRREGYFNDSFKPHADGRVTAVRFCQTDELSTGEVYERIV